MKVTETDDHIKLDFENNEEQDAIFYIFIHSKVPFSGIKENQIIYKK